MNIKLLTCNYCIPILLLQSCTTFRTHIDQNCAEQYSDQYISRSQSEFILPWKVGESYTLTQGNCSLESHNFADRQHMSFDFRMPIGTPVLAVSDGRIAAVIEQFHDNVDQNYNQANLIGIEHADGILSWYMHLKNQGAIVDVDDQVLKGDIIGYSGNTGMSSYPHLHFYMQQITEECNDQENHTAKLDICPVIPTTFSNASPTDNILKEWQAYSAQPYQ
jgi:murein DD-endopeptidase MepM/ murein hydrolase activator NlpD